MVRHAAAGGRLRKQNCLCRSCHGRYEISKCAPNVKPSTARQRDGTRVRATRRRRRAHRRLDERRVQDGCRRRDDSSGRGSCPGSGGARLGAAPLWRMRRACLEDNDVVQFSRRQAKSAPASAPSLRTAHTGCARRTCASFRGTRRMRGGQGQPPPIRTPDAHKTSATSCP